MEELSIVIVGMAGVAGGARVLTAVWQHCGRVHLCDDVKRKHRLRLHGPAPRPSPSTLLTVMSVAAEPHDTLGTETLPLPLVYFL